MEAWRTAAAAQGGLITRAQLRAAGVSARACAWRVGAERWQWASPDVIATTTGELSADQRRWLGVLHAGPDALLGGLTAAALGGLLNWQRDEVTVLVPYAARVPQPLPGFCFERTRRPLTMLRSRASGVPHCRLEPAVLLFAARQRNGRTRDGVVAAAIQQRLTTPDAFAEWLERLAPLRGAAAIRAALGDIAGGAHSVAELDLKRMCRRFGLSRPLRQVRRRDARGRLRFTDCEWRLPDGRTLILEVDGGFHMEVEHWEDDLARQRALSGGDRVIVRCTARDLRALGAA